jgi:hypothetical protein
MKQMPSPSCRCLFLQLLLLLLTSAGPASALVITPIWDSTITTDPNASTIESSIMTAIQFYQARFAVPITVTIDFQEMSSGLGESGYEYYNIPYTQFLGALQNNAISSNANYAFSLLSPGPNNPVTGDANINVHVDTLYAVGLASELGIADGSVGNVYLNTSMMNLSRTNIDPSKYDLIAVVEHEMDEVLVLGSDLPDTDDPFPEDLFRYSTNGTLTFTTSGDDAYFSLDGTNLLVQFNQESDGDYGDWWTTGPHTPRVQDAFATPGATPNPNVEIIALDVMGFEALPPPQPGIVNITLSGNNLVLNATNGLATGIYHVLASTNLAVPLNQWSPVATNVLTANGDFAITATNAVNRLSNAKFYVLQLQ